jgi:hypothetical protein
VTADNLRNNYFCKLAMPRFSDSRLRHVYMAGFGRLGEIDDLAVSFRGGLVEWFRSQHR